MKRSKWGSKRSEATKRDRKRKSAGRIPRFETLEDRRVLASDFGDAPDLGVGTATNTYETLLVSNGPRHTIDTIQTTLYLGASVDSD